MVFHPLQELLGRKCKKFSEIDLQDEKAEEKFEEERIISALLGDEEKRKEETP